MQTFRQEPRRFPIVTVLADLPGMERLISGLQAVSGEYYGQRHVEHGQMVIRNVIDGELRNVHDRLKELGFTNIRAFAVEIEAISSLSPVEPPSPQPAPRAA